MNNLRVLAIMPHPDDIEILCAGTLLLLKDSGAELHVATMTPGDKGSAELSRARIAAIRRGEARAAADYLGVVSYNCLEFADLEIVFDNPSRKRVAGLLRRIRPDIVITTPPQDYMFDHEITSALVRDACFNAAVPNYESEGNAPPSESIPSLYYSDPIGGHNIYGEDTQPHLIVDISAMMERKAGALACHASQRAWLQKQHGIDEYIEAMKRWCATRGGVIGAAYAEGFTRHLGHPHPEANPLAALPGAVDLIAR